MNIGKKVIPFIIFSIVFHWSDGQITKQCFKDFDILLNQGFDIETSCINTPRVECFYKDGNIFKLFAVRQVYGKTKKERISTYKKGSIVWYCFEKSIMPVGEKLSLRIIVSEKWKWYDTLMIKDDTIFRKSLLNKSMEMSKCFHLINDTFKIISFHWTYISKRAKKKSLLQFAENNDITGSLDSTIIFFTLNKTGTRFFKYATTSQSVGIDEKSLNESNEWSTASNSLFWFFIYYRFIIGNI